MVETEQSGSTAACVCLAMDHADVLQILPQLDSLSALAPRWACFFRIVSEAIVLVLSVFGPRCPKFTWRLLRAGPLNLILKLVIIDQRITVRPALFACIQFRLWRPVGDRECCVPALQFGEIAMISPTKCRKFAAECKLLALSSDISAQRSLEQTIMALNWAALADEIDRDNARAASVVFSPLGGPVASSNLACLTHPRRQVGEVAA